MTEPFMGEIRRVPFAFAPRGWALCNGQILQIATNQALFSLIGTTYGGNGIQTFALPDLRGRAPIHPGSGASIVQGQSGGTPSVTLVNPNLPTHTHLVAASTAAASVSSPQNAYWAATDQPTYGTAASGTLAAGAVQPAGTAQPHENQPPFLVINHIIALTGIYPTRD